jgi:iron complex transport system permease protein
VIAAPSTPWLDRFVVVRARRLGWSTRVHARSLLVGTLLLVAALLVFAWSLTIGDYPLSFGDVVATLFGGGDDDSAFIVRTLRLPRGLTGLLVGAAFGLSGAILQRLVRNPLASPDVVGVSAGAATAAVFVLIILDGSSTQAAFAALLGSFATIAAVYLFAYRRGVTGYRFVLIGIGMTAMLTAITSWLLTQGRVLEAQRAVVWLTGSLNARGWEHVRPVAVGLVVLVPVTIYLARHLRTLELGDEAARGLGTRVEAARGGLLLTATALAALATAAAGPVAFVGLAAPQISRRLVGGRSLGLLPAALCGALLMVASDLVGRRVFAPTELPVGIITAIVGAPYFLYLLARAERIGSAG